MLSGGITLGGSRAECSVTVESTVGLSGIATITLTVSDGEHVTSASFVLMVGKSLKQLYLPMVLHGE